MKMKKLTCIAAIALAVGVLAGLPSAAQALTFGDAFDLGSITNTPEPADPVTETHFVNTLIGVTPGGTFDDVFSGMPHHYTRTLASCGTCPAAVFAFKDESGNNVVDLGTGGFTYLLGKYDGPNGGDEVWNVQGLTGIVTIPLKGFGPDNNKYGLSHFTLFGGGGQVPDGGTTAALLGAALAGIGFLRRYIKR
jgi:hypothetical protein